MSDRDALLHRTAEIAAEFIDGLPARPVGRPVDLTALRAALDVPLPDGPSDPQAVIEALARGADPGVIATAGPRYFGFVIGGGVPAALAADWLASAWDQNAALYAVSPAASVVEEVAARWLVELFGLPQGSSVGFVTGATMATFTALAAGRHRVLERAGWNIEEDGYVGAPPIEVVVGDEAHVTVFVSLQMLGLGRNRVHKVASDGQGRMMPASLREVLAGIDGPTLVSAQSGNVNTGGFDPLEEIVPIVRERPNAWLHVDGAFGLWAAANPATRPLMSGIEMLDSWAVDGHKWLNVPHDSGYVFCAHPVAHAAAMAHSAAYLTGQGQGGLRSPGDFVMESSRRARGFATWAALRELGRSGVADLVERCCALARRFAHQLGSIDGVMVVNDVVLNQVLVSFGDDRRTDLVVEQVQRSGECWMGATTWHGQRLMRISVSNSSTTEADVDRSVTAIRNAHHAVTTPS